MLCDPSGYCGNLLARWPLGQRNSPPSAVLAASLALFLGSGSGCTLTPTSPGILVMPNQAESFDQFKSDDAVCREYAEQSVNGYTPNNGMAASGILSTLAAGALGAIAGGAWGGAVMGGGRHRISRRRSLRASKHPRIAPDRAATLRSGLSAVHGCPRTSGLWIRLFVLRRDGGPLSGPSRTPLMRRRRG